MTFKDDDGNIIEAGDTVYFSYGIPPVGVTAKIINEDGKLLALVPPPHSPDRCTLRYLLKYFNVYKQFAGVGK